MQSKSNNTEKIADRTTKAAVVQLVSGSDIGANLSAAALQIKIAKDAGAELVVLPESFAVFATKQLLSTGQQELNSNGPLRSWMARQARALGIWVVGGTIPCQQGVSNNQRVRASCFVYDNLGKEVARYDKIHLFDAQVQDRHGTYRESDMFESGSSPVVVDSPIGRLGLTICYDLRFAEFHQILVDQRADVICNGAAFTQRTGEAHWQTLLRARAIDYQCYVLAAAQGGVHSNTRTTYGHSMIIDPWGTVIQSLETGEGVLVADIDPALVESTRQNMPIAFHRKLL